MPQSSIGAGSHAAWYMAVKLAAVWREVRQAVTPVMRHKPKLQCNLRRRVE